MSKKRRDFSTLIRSSSPAPRTSPAAPLASPSDSLQGAREATWRRIFAERELVWTPHSLIAPDVAHIVDDEARRLAESGESRAIHTSAGSRLSEAARDALWAKAASFTARVVIPPLELRPSSLGALVGLGLFAANALPEGEVIGEYTGLVLRIEDIEERGAYAYEPWPGSPLAIDACTAGNHTRFVNHATDPNLDVLQCAIDGTWHVLFVARRNIAADEELFADYGDTYWRRRRMIET